MIDFVMEHWLSIAAGAFLVGMTLYGHYRGLIRIAVTMSALVISIVVVRLATPCVSSFLRENTQVQHMMQEVMLHAVGADSLLDEESSSATELPAFQRTIIEQLNLPDSIKEALLENNNSEIYRLLGVDTFLEYIGVYLANMVLNLIASILIFLLVYIGLKLLTNTLDLVARLPILCGINQIAGALIGLLSGLLWLWAIFVVLDMASGMGWAKLVLEEITDTTWLSVLYQYNPLGWIFIGILKCLM